MPKVRISDNAHKQIDLLRGNKTQKDFIDTLIRRYNQAQTLKKNLHEKELEVERLRCEKPSEAHPNEHGQSPGTPLPEPQKAQIQCPALLEIEGIYYCAKSAPRIVKLPSLDICEAHLKWFKIHENLTRSYTFTNCGAEQTVKDGEIWLACPLDHGVLHRWSDCQKAKCRHVKTVKAEKT